MKKILVSLISEQTVPNILVIHHFKPDELFFITSEEMEKKGKTASILATLSLLDQDYRQIVYTVNVHEDDFFDCRRKIDEWVQGHGEAEFIVNLTCGTKIMSLSTFEYFREYGSRMLYVPIPKNEFAVLFPKKLSNIPINITLRLSVIQYLTAYGLTIRNGNKLNGNNSKAFSRRELSEWIVEHYPEVKSLLSWFASDEGGNLRRFRDERKGYYLEGTFSGPNEEERILLEKTGFDFDGRKVAKKLERPEIQYLTGGWLEEFCFNEISKYKGKGVDDVVIGPDILNRLGRNNEFDVMFTKDNALYTIECKSLDQKYDKKQDILYKIGALQKDFGLRVGSFLVSTSPSIMKNGKIDPSIEYRAKQFNTTVITPDDVPCLGRRIAEALGI